MQVTIYHFKITHNKTFQHILLIKLGNNRQTTKHLPIIISITLQKNLSYSHTTRQPATWVLA